LKNVNRVFVLNSDRTPLSPCHPARARELLTKGKAAVFRNKPFTIILNKLKINPKFQNTQVKIDPGSKTTGLAITLKGKKCGWFLIWAANLEHRGEYIKKLLEKRKNVRRNRRHRKCRYRQPRFLNRKRKEGWLPPSILSRINNVIVWVEKLQEFCYLRSCIMEVARFNMQKMMNPEIRGVEYQQGTLQGYDVREYLLEKYHRTCIYCSKKNVPLEIEHVVPKSKGGSNRVSNLTLACKICNQRKGNQPIEFFLKRKPELLRKIKRSLKVSLKDAAAVNIIRKRLRKEVDYCIETKTSTGSITKFNRTKQYYKKDHWIDAACVGKRSGRNVSIPDNFQPLLIKAMGRGRRQMCLVDKYGFPRAKSKSRNKIIKGFQTGDIVKAIVTEGKKVGTYVGRIAVRNKGTCDISTKESLIQGISLRYCKLLQKIDGYSYKLLTGG